MSAHPSVRIVASSAAQPAEQSQTIAIALDGSERSNDAFNWAVSNAYRPGDKLIFFTVAGTNLSTDREDEKAETILRPFLSHCVAHNISCDAVHCMGTDFAELGNAVVDQFRPNIFVTGCSNKGRMDRLVLGSTSDTFLHTLNIPVVVVKNPFTYPTLEEASRRRVAVAIDGSDHARTAFNWVAHRFRKTGDAIYIINISTTVSKTKGGEVAAEVTHDPGLAGVLSGERLMETYAGAIRDEGLAAAEEAGECIIHLVHSRTRKSSAEAFAELCKSLSIDTVVVGSRGRGVVARTLLGSFAEEFVHQRGAQNVVVLKS